MINDNNARIAADISRCIKRNHKTLILNCSGVDRISMALKQCAQLRELEISSLSISLPLEILSIPNLQRLILKNCSDIGEMPDFELLPKLTNFSRSYYPPREDRWGRIFIKRHDFKLPYGDYLRNLESIKLGGGKFVNPQLLAEMKNLRHLRLCCDLDHLPTVIDNLKNLGTISINFAYSLKNLPDSIVNLPHLREVSLFYCGITHASPAMENFGKIIFNISGTIFDNDPTEYNGKYLHYR